MDMKTDVVQVSKFMSKVDVSGECWMWMNSKNASGHGRVRLSKGGKLHLAHRVSYEMFVGTIPDGSVVRHSCDNPSCVKPTHLLVGSQGDNMADMAKRERGRIKLTNEQAREIRERYIPRGNGNGYGNTKALCEEYGISRYTVHEIATGKSRTFA